MKRMGRRNVDQERSTGRVRAGLVWALGIAAPIAISLALALPAGARSAGAAPILPLPSLPVNLSTPTPPQINPPALPTALPTVTLPVSLPTATPSLPVATPSLPITLGTPTPTVPGVLPSAGGPAGAGGGGSGGTNGGGGQGPGGGIKIPLTSIVIRSPLDAALVGAIAGLPLLFGIWLLVFGRTLNEARRSRDAQVRLAVAHDLGLSPRELTSVSTRVMFKLREEAAFDELTGVLRRAAGISALDREIARARRQKAPLAVAFLDVDGLKEANDKRGHKAGDELLRGLASILKGSLRAQDLVLRYGGDEFICVLPDTVGDAARAKISWMQTEAEAQGIGFSSGVAQLERSDDVVSLLGRADQEMYAVKSRRGKVRDLRLGVVGGTKTVPA